MEHSFVTQQLILSTFGIESARVALTNGTELEIVAVVRLVPGRRVVCRAQWNGQYVYAKFFAGKKAHYYCERDKLGVGLLIQHNIKTPPLLFADKLKQIDAEVLVFAEIKPSENAEVVWRASDSNKRFDLAVRLVLELAGHHRAHLLQTDLYLKNFLVSDDSIYTLDGDGVRHYSKLSRQCALANLATLLSKFDVLDVQAWLVDLLKVYADASARHTLPSHPHMLRLINHKRKGAANRYADAKVFRKCTDVEVDQTSRHFQAISTQFPLIQSSMVSEKLDDLINTQTLLKSGNTCTVALANIENVPLVIKRYNIKNIWHGIARALRKTRASASWANAYRLTLLGIATPKPIALIEQRYFGLRGKAYFVSEYLEAPDANLFFEQKPEQVARATAIHNIVILFYRLFLLKISHGDMKATNIKLLDASPWLIDLDSMRQHDWDGFALKAHVQDLKRFMKNWQDEPSLYNAFIKEFFAVYADPHPLRLAGLSNY
ncbi:MAG: lipopolysaccharide kinase InaA family protein [Methylotenera sp.]|nr:lipopolysaccharide kinase InaA family protein [Methylotenera sp.]